MRKSLLPFLVAGLTFSFSYAQNDIKKTEKHSENDTPTFIEFNKGKKFAINAREAIKEALKCGSSDDFRLEKEEADELGFTHAKYRQYYKGIKVEHGVYISHERGGMIESLSGDYKKGDDSRKTKADLKEEDALAVAMKFSGGTEFMWQTEDAESYYAKYKGKNQPEGELVWVENLKSDRKEDRTVLRLAYKFDIYTTAPTEKRDYIYVDANDGSILHVQPRIYHANAPATFATRYSGTQAATTDSFNGSYRLRNTTSTNSVVQTLNLRNRTRYTQAVSFTDANNQWTEYNNTAKDNSALDAHLGANNTFNYFKNVHNRNSYNNAGAILTSYVHYSTNYVNAFWNGSVMTYGDGDGTNFDPLTSQDVCSHELGHAVCEYSANLVYQKESGALNEALSDIWGACVEYYYFPTKSTWLMGEDFDKNASNGLGFRSMSNPNQFSDPDTYGGTYWLNPNCTPAQSNDYCGVHTNSGVLNYFFYLLVNGGSGTNDVGNAFNVTGIGITDAAKIMYRMETVYMTSTTNYAGARTGAIQAATDLFGAGSQQVISTTNAFYAVNVGAAFPSARMASLAEPTNLESFDVSEDTFSATWKGVNGADEYDVELWDGADWQIYATTKSTLIKVEGLEKGQQMAWRVIAKDIKGNSSDSKSSLVNLSTNKDEGIASMKFYPNPSKEIVQLSYKSTKEANLIVQITDLAGRTYIQNVSKVSTGENQLEYNIQNLSKGQYILKVLDNSDVTKPKQFTKALVIED
ncbi:MAG: M4 family metallopeptidase [Spirosomataceae bacterium]